MTTTPGTALIEEPVALAQEAVNPLTLLQTAVDRGMDPGQLKQLVDLHEQWRAARAKEAFAAAMNAVQAEMPVVVRDATNSHTNSGYVRLETVTHRAKPIYSAHGFSLSFSEEESTKGNLHRHVCLIRHVDGHTERHWIDLPTDGTGAKGGKSSMNEVQGCISTGSYAQRVLTCRVFNITIADTDLDGAPLAPNPTPNGNAPQARPRAVREVSLRPRIERIGNLWRAANPRTDGDRTAWAVDYKKWAMEVCDRVFDATKESQWTDADCAKCEAELNIDAEGMRL